MAALGFNGIREAFRVMGKLFIVATPIGNLEDITIRALKVLGSADVLACEDTRRTRRIFERHGIPCPRIILSCHEHNEEQAAGRIAALVEQGRTVALCSNAGYPALSDPGYRVIAECLRRGIEVDVIPGASAIPLALLSAGVPTSSYTFKGFPPRNRGPRIRFLEADKDLPHSLVFFESPYRTAGFLQDALEVLGNRQAAVCIELTKAFQRVHRGALEDLARQFAGTRIRGEVTIVIAGNHPKFTAPAHG